MINTGQYHDLPNSSPFLQHVIVEGMRKSDNPETQEMVHFRFHPSLSYISIFIAAVFKLAFIGFQSSLQWFSNWHYRLLNWLENGWWQITNCTKKQRKCGRRFLLWSRVKVAQIVVRYRSTSNRNLLAKFDSETFP